MSRYAKAKAGDPLDACACSCGGREDDSLSLVACGRPRATVRGDLLARCMICYKLDHPRSFGLLLPD